MTHLIVEQTFETLLIDEDHGQLGQRLDQVWRPTAAAGLRIFRLGSLSIAITLLR